MRRQRKNNKQCSKTKGRGSLKTECSAGTVSIRLRMRLRDKAWCDAGLSICSPNTADWQGCMLSCSAAHHLLATNCRGLTTFGNRPYRYAVMRCVKRRRFARIIRQPMASSAANEAAQMLIGQGLPPRTCKKRLSA